MKMKKFLLVVSLAFSYALTARAWCGEDLELSSLFSRAASLFRSNDPPRALDLLDDAKVEWRTDRSMKITVHRVRAVRTKPSHPLPPLAVLNQDSQTLTVQSLQIYDIDANGNFTLSPVKPEMQLSAPAPDLPASLSKIVVVRLPEPGENQALEARYTLETKTSTLMSGKDISKEQNKPRLVAAEPSFAFRWNDFTPAMDRSLTIKVPKLVPLLGSRLRLPKALSVVEDRKTDPMVLHLSLAGPMETVPVESYQPALQDLAPLTAFTVYKSWDDAVMPYRVRTKRILDGDIGPVTQMLDPSDLPGVALVKPDASGNTGLPLLDRLTLLKNALHRKVDCVDTGLPVYLNPDRSPQEILDSRKGTPHDMAVLLAALLKYDKIDARIYLYRRSTSGSLLTDLPALSQFDGVLVGVPDGKQLLWMDPTEPLAPPGVLPLSALGQQALAVPAPVQWNTTPPFSVKDHRKERDVTMEFQPNGTLNCSVDLTAYGSSELALRDFFRTTPEDDRRELVLKGLSRRFPGAVLTGYRFGDYTDLAHPLDVQYSFEVPDYARFQADGGFQFYPLVFEDVEDFFTVLRDTRKTPIVAPQNFNSITRVVVKLPPGYQVKELPKDGAMSNPEAEFLSTARLQFGTLTYERYLGLKQRAITPGKGYNDLLNFYQVVLGQDRTPFNVVKGDFKYAPSPKKAAVHSRQSTGKKKAAP